MLQGDCDGRLSYIDTRNAQTKERGGYRQFQDMAQQNVNTANGNFASFSDDFIVVAKANATLYFALRMCSGDGIPMPFRFQASVISEKPRDIGAVCLANSFKQDMPNNTLSVFCESDLGVCRGAALPCALISLTFALQVRAAFYKATGRFVRWRTRVPSRGTRCARSSLCSAQPSALTCAPQLTIRVQVVALLAVLFAFAATCTYVFFLWKYNGK